jgi:hypothetical protein
MRDELSLPVSGCTNSEAIVSHGDLHNRSVCSQRHAHITIVTMVARKSAPVQELSTLQYPLLATEIDQIDMRHRVTCNCNHYCEKTGSAGWDAVSPSPKINMIYMRHMPLIHKSRNYIGWLALAV